MTAMRTILAAVLVLVTLAGRSQTWTVDGVTYEVTSEATAAVALGDAFYRGSVIVPASVEGHAVTAVAAGAFNGCHGLTSVSLPETVTTIGDYAFNGCDSLEDIVIPARVTRIGRHAFNGCTMLTAINVPDAVTNIGDYAFYGCNHVTGVTVGRGLENLGYRVFQGCKMLQSIEVSQDNTHFVSRGGVLYDASMTRLVASPRRQSSRRDVAVPATVRHIAPYACHGMGLTRSVTLPDGLLTIGERAFAGSSVLTSVTLPDALEHIGVDAFDGCTKLEQVRCLSRQPVALSEYLSPFGYLTDLSRRTLWVPRGTLRAYRAAPVWNRFGTICEEGTAGPGDVNGDGEVTVADITALVGVVMGEPLPNDYRGRADVNNDGEATVADVTALVSLVMASDP